MNDSVRTVAEMRPADVILEQVVVLDWYDGPREGFLKLTSSPSVWHFQIIGSAPTENGLDDRLYLLSKVADDALDKIVTVAGQGEHVPAPLWIPAWQFDDDAARRRADETVDELVRQKQPGVIVQSSDLMSFKAIWRAE